MQRTSSPHAPIDRMGRLLAQGADVAAYLFQVPDDHGERLKVAAILDEIRREAAPTNARELPKIAAALRRVLAEPPSSDQAARLQDGFDRMRRLWAAARSGIF